MEVKEKQPVESVQSERPQQQPAVSEAEAQQQPTKAKRPPQFVTNAGQEITHGHVGKSKNNEHSLFFCKVDGYGKVSAPLSDETVKLWNERKVGVKDMVALCFPEVLTRMTREQWNAARDFEIPEYGLSVRGVNVNKEKNPDKVYFYGKYCIYAKVNGKSVQAEMEDKKSLNDYFQRNVSPKELFVRKFGNRYQMREHYQQFSLPPQLEGAKIFVKAIDKPDGKTGYLVKLTHDLLPGEPKGKWMPSKVDYDAYKITGLATKEQLAAKYYSDEIFSAKMKGWKKPEPKQAEDQQTKMKI